MPSSKYLILSGKYFLIHSIKVFVLSFFKADKGTISLNGYLLNLKDTAGLRKTKNIVEKIGVNRSLETISNSDLLIYVLSN